MGRLEPGRVGIKTVERLGRKEMERIVSQDLGKLEKEELMRMDQDLGKSVAREVKNPFKEQCREKMRDFYNKRKPKTRKFDIPPSR